MSQVFHEVTFTWGGEDYTIVPSLALLRRIKAKGINALRLANECLNGGVDPLDLVEVHRIFMAQAGVSVSEDDSYAFIVSGSPEMIEFQLSFVSCVLPSVDLGKKPKPRTKATRGKKATSQK